MAHTAAEQEASAASVKPILWARLSVNHTKKTCAISCAVPIVALVIVIFATSLSIDDPSERDFLVRDDIRSIREDGRRAARERYPYRGRGAPPDDTAVSRGESSFYHDLAILFRGRVGKDGPVGIFDDTQSQATNLLTKEGLALMKKAEDVLWMDPELGQFCLNDPSARDCDGNPLKCVLPKSVLMSEHLYGRWTGEGEERRLCGRKEGNQQVSDVAFDDFIDSLVERDQDGNLFVKPLFSSYIGTDFTPDNRESWVAHSYFPIGVPFEGFATEDDRSAEQDKAYDTWASAAAELAEGFTTEDVDVFLASSALVNGSFNSIIVRDLSFSIAAIVMVFFVIWFHTSSAFLASSAMLQIFLAFPFSYFFYRVVFRQNYFAALQILVIFLILGIGADDVFVFTDAWRQSVVVLGSQCDLVTRMSWTYRRAAKAMSVTSITTAAAFFVTASSPIMPIGTLGVWAGTLVLLQFLLVITIYPCSVVIWYRFWRARPITNCFRRAVENSESAPRVPLWHRCLPLKWRPAAEANGVDEYRSIEKLFRGKWTNAVNRFRFILLGVAVVLVAVSLYLATRLQPPSENEEFLPESNPLRVAVITLDRAFPRSEAALQLEVRITWGIVGTDRTGTSKFDPADTGTPILDEKFDLKNEAGQRHLLNACIFFRSKKNLLFQEETIDADDRIQCWIEKYKTWREDMGNGNFETFSTEAALIEDIIAFGNHETDGGKPNLPYLTNQHIAFNDELNRIVFTELRFLSPVEAAEPYKVMFPVYEEWQRELDAFNDQTPGAIKDSVGNAIATGGYSWTYMITQRTLVRTMFVGIAVMLAVALVALCISTANWAIAIVATATISGIVAMLLGLISLYGWELGITESIGVVIAIGYSFDGAAHIATAYIESRNVQRFERTRDALTDLGISVLFGALTTFLAGCMLFPAIIVFFFKFAGLIVSTIALSLLWSLVFLPSMLLVLGPTGDFGSFKAFYRKLRSRSLKKQITESEEPHASPKEIFADEAQDGGFAESNSNKDDAVHHKNTAGVTLS
ncbi:unnamed protein product [Chondrus crispus]|uniref:SSD domain-containing protein n=1 Tax=Chondrus crispus TaxID=2769 RepID=R7QR56_CHOCR|nr:unnamed protein product [Chondrus crispus]CDF40962.1 unnamed protein product [Chondrus crispus]|eukprot:XP_005711256.1 unnamed protein product [Chondrus crispus]